ncbi:ribonuclease Z [Flavobacteriales bacterium]|jgi:hypothetical protein|nr:ribonuclease Z [Flavobacteriales bacterium]|tara:strand:+ start:891 stop:1184 length:294 start_codon:yes stop_codon:yes gene_type:complete
MNNNTLVFRLTEKNDFSKLNISKEVKNFIADLTDVQSDVYELLIDKFITFGKITYANKGSFVIVSNISFSDELNIVPTIQEAYDFIDMEDIERQLDV